MYPKFIAILQKIIIERGKEAFLDKSKCREFLEGYTNSEYKKESSLLLQALEAGVQKAIKTAENITICKKKQIRLLHEVHGLDKKVAADVVDTLVFVFRGMYRSRKPRF
jgi:hypothetical protein